MSLIVKQADLDSFANSFEALTLPIILTAFVFLAFGNLLRVVRWWWLLRALEPGLALSRCIGPYLASVAVNNVLPLRAGDALRVVGFSQQLRSPPMRVLGSVVVERVLDVAVLLAVFVLSDALLADNVLPPIVVTLGVWLLVLWVAGAVSLVWLAPHLVGLRCRTPGGALRLLARRRWWGVVASQLGHLGDALALARSFRRTLFLVGLSVVSWICEGTVFVVVAFAFGADYLSVAPWLSLAASMLATVIPSSPGYIGTFDYFAAQGIAVGGFSPSQAVAFAVTVHTVIWVGLTAAGAPFALLRAVGIRRRGSGR